MSPSAEGVKAAAALKVAKSAVLSVIFRDVWVFFVVISQIKCVVKAAPRHAKRADRDRKREHSFRGSCWQCPDVERCREISLCLFAILF